MLHTKWWRNICDYLICLNSTQRPLFPWFAGCRIKNAKRVKQSVLVVSMPQIVDGTTFLPLETTKRKNCDFSVFDKVNCPYS